MGGIIDRVRYSSLDGLRGVAAGSVLLHHSLIVAFPQLRAIYSSTVPFDSYTWEWWLTHTPLHVGWLGAEAVYVFFILSGFVLVLPVLAGQPGFRWDRYYPSRLIRLYLPVWGSLMFVIGVTLVVLWLAPGGGGELFQDRVPLLTLKRLLRDGALVTGVSQLDGVLWSLQWEVIFSVLLPVFVVFAKHLRTLWILKIVLLFALVYVGATVFEKNDVIGPALTFLPMFGLGAVIAVERDRLASLRAMIGARAIVWPIVLTICVLLLCVRWIALAFSLSSFLPVAHVVSLVGAAMAVSIAIVNPAIERFLNRRWPQWLGRISFSLYLTHAIVLESVAAFAPENLRATLVLASASGALLVALAFYRAVETPSHNLSQWVRRGRRRPAARAG